MKSRESKGGSADKSLPLCTTSFPCPFRLSSARPKILPKGIEDVGASAQVGRLPPWEGRVRRATSPSILLIHPGRGQRGYSYGHRTPQRLSSRDR